MSQHASTASITLGGGGGGGDVGASRERRRRDEVPEHHRPTVYATAGFNAAAGGGGAAPSPQGTPQAVGHISNAGAHGSPQGTPQVIGHSSNTGAAQPSPAGSAGGQSSTPWRQQSRSSPAPSHRAAASAVNAARTSETSAYSFGGGVGQMGTVYTAKPQPKPEKFTPNQPIQQAKPAPQPAPQPYIPGPQRNGSSAQPQYQPSAQPQHQVQPKKPEAVNTYEPNNQYQSKASFKPISQSNSQPGYQPYSHNQPSNNVQPKALYNSHEDPQCPIKPQPQYQPQQPTQPAQYQPQQPTQLAQYQPQQPTQPAQYQPQQPTQPAQYQPKQPTQPAQYQPQQPTQPAQYQPQQPTQPAQYQPQQPTQLAQYQPQQPNQPAQYQPQQPTQPAQYQPQQPTQPAQYQPKQPTQPPQYQPQQPTQPAQYQPQQPTQPPQYQPQQPTQPAQYQPQQPTQPAQPQPPPPPRTTKHPPVVIRSTKSTPPPTQRPPQPRPDIDLKRQEEARQKMVEMNLSPQAVGVYKKRFDILDLNKDGVVNLREFAAISRVLGYKFSKEEVLEIFGRRDLDDSGSISFEEFVIAMADRQAKNKELAPYRTKFREYDWKGTGYVTSDEAWPVLKKELGFDEGKTEMLIDCFDRNRDYRLSLLEFIDFYKKVQELKTLVMNAFRSFDTDGDGFVSFGEMAAMLQPKGFTDDQVHSIILKHDKDSDGQLNYQEFAAFWDIPISQ